MIPNEAPETSVVTCSASVTVKVLTRTESWW